MAPISRETVEIDIVSTNMVVRLAVAIVYGVRRSEITEISKGNIVLWCSFYAHARTNHLKINLIICKKAFVILSHRVGYQCFRRGTITTVFYVDPSDTNVEKFIRWAK